MNRIVIILLLGLSVFLLSGCIEVGYKTEVTLSLFKKERTPMPVIVDDDYPVSPVQSLQVDNEVIEQSYESRPIMSTERKGFTAFKRRER
jgi:hypothetical protein